MSPNSQRWSDMCGTISRIEVTPDGDLVVETNLAAWTWSPVGDCCANAYIEAKECAEELPAMIGQEIVLATVAAGDSLDGEGDTCHDITFYKILGRSSDLTITLHVEHNGYYGGELDCSSYVEAV